MFFFHSNGLQSKSDGLKLALCEYTVFPINILYKGYDGHVQWLSIFNMSVEVLCSILRNTSELLMEHVPTPLPSHRISSSQPVQRGVLRNLIVACSRTADALELVCGVEALKQP